MNDLPHGLNVEDLKALEELDGNIQIGPDITYDEYVWLVRWIIRRRRRALHTGQISQIVTTPTVLSVAQSAPVGTVVGTLSVINGFGTYTFSFVSNPGGFFSIVGNQIQVASALPSPQTIPVTIQASNGLGDTVVLSTTITVTAAAVHPTYFIYGF